MELEIVKLGASKLNSNTKAPQWQALNDVGEEPGDSEDFGDVDIFQALGVTSMPWPADEDANAEGVIVRNCGNRNAVCVGARDLRTASAYGNTKPGDTVLHSTGPSQAAQVQCKEEKRQVVLFTKDSESKGMVVCVDGKNDQIQMVAFGMIIEMTRKNGIKLDNGKASILIQDDGIWLNGTLHIKGIPPGHMLCSVGPAGVTGAPPSPSNVGIPVMGTGQ